jgi:hypothetical protein
MTNNQPPQKEAMPSPTVAVPPNSASSSSALGEKHAEQGKHEKLHAAVKKNWNKLSDEDINLYETSPDRFFSKVKDLHGINQEDAKKKMGEIKTSCGCGTEKAA